MSSERGAGHSFLYWLTLDMSWSNDLNAREMHRILEEVANAVEMAVRGISAVVMTSMVSACPISRKRSRLTVSELGRKAEAADLGCPFNG